MKTTGVGSFLTVAILAALLTPSFAIAPKDDQTGLRMQAAHQNQLVIRNEAAIKARARLGASGQSAGPSNRSTMIAPPSVADGSVRALKTLPATNPRNVSRHTELAGIPYDIWCMIHFCKRWG